MSFRRGVFGLFSEDLDSCDAPLAAIALHYRAAEGILSPSIT